MDKFTPKRLLGRSNFEVWEATNNLTGRTVALKYVPYRSDDEVPTLLEEVKKQVALRHPKIVEVYGADVDTDNRRMLIEMELADAGSLESRLGDGKHLPVEEALRIITDVLEALEHAHNNRVVHFDIKPANILLFKDGTAKLADFGIAKTLGSRSVVQGAGGTEGYTGPEYYRSKREFGKPTDLWATSVVLYEMLVGVRPFPSVEEIFFCRFAPITEHLPENPSAARVQSALEKVFVNYDERLATVAALRTLLFPTVTPATTWGLTVEQARALPPTHPAPRTLAEYKAQMVSIPGGTFEMGSSSVKSDEKPVHSVTLSPFRMGRTPVTVAMWSEFCMVMGRAMPELPSYGTVWQGGWGSVLDHPIVNVSWEDCQDYARWAGLELPTEAQWEYASLGGVEGKVYPWAGSMDDSKCWYRDTSRNNGTAPVSRSNNVYVNGYGLVDPSGNARQWCSDWYGGYASVAQTNPTGASSSKFRVIRGCAWDDIGAFAVRMGILPDFRIDNLGCRLSSE